MSNRTPLGDLIYKVRTLADMSGEDVARRARSKGFGLTRSGVSELETQDGLPSITARKIKALAAGLQISEERVAIEAVRSLGVDIALHERPIRELINDSSEITPHTKRAVLAIIDSEKKAGEGRDRSPSTKPGGAPISLQEQRRRRMIQQATTEVEAARDVEGDSQD